MEAKSGILDSIVSLPSGGGALKPLGDRFQPDLVRGTGNYSIPLEVPRGHADLRPSLSLRYSTGHGNGQFGMGWQLSGPLIISRRTDVGVPSYDAHDEFVLNGAEILVPVGENRYRPRTETQFWMIRQEGESWSIRTKEGRRFLLGTSPAFRIESPLGTYSWLLDKEIDPHGNIIQYRWEVDQGYPYLVAVEWSIFALHFEYEARPDRVFSGRAGFPQSATRRCSHIERHTVTELQPVTARYVFSYEQAEGTELSLLSGVRLEGVAADLTVEKYPSLQFAYGTSQREVPSILHVQSKGSPPPSLDNPDVALIDMNGDGLPDLLETDVGGHRWWPNLGQGVFGSVRKLNNVPAGMNIGRSGVTFADIDGDGAADLLRIEPRLSVAVMNTAEGGWADRPLIFTRQLPLRFTSTTTRLIDIDGNGIPDLLQSGPGGLLITYNLGEAGWSEPQVISRLSDPDHFTAIDLASEEIEIADMTGDGLSDLVLLASGRLDYWPSLGKGRWDKRVSMRNAPVLPQHYDRERLYLSDIDGDGCADLIYVDLDRVLYWLNKSGLAWSNRYEIPFIPPPGPAKVTLCDFLGTGAPGILWYARPRSGGDTGYRFLSLVSSAKPYLLRTIDDGFGGVTEINYITSSALRSSDEAAGIKWDSYLPFSLQVVDSIAQTDRITGRVNRTSFRYHRGYYDGYEREFRGFERVEQRSDGDANTPTIIQESIFYQGEVGGPQRSRTLPSRERSRQRALVGSLIEHRTYEVASDGSHILRRSAVIQWNTREEFANKSFFVHFPHMVHMEAHELAQGGADRIETASYSYDEFGNVVQKIHIATFAGDHAAQPISLEQTVSYVRNEADWIVGLPASIESRGTNGEILKHDLHFYDGTAFIGLPLGQATRGILKRSRELVYVDALLPSGFTDFIASDWGLVHDGFGWYRDTIAYDHDAQGNITSQRDALGTEKRIQYDANNVFPRRLEEPGGLVTECQFEPRTAQPLELRLSDGRITRYEYSPLGRVRSQFDTGSDGNLSLTQAFCVDFGNFSANPAQPARIISIRPNDPNRSASDFHDGMDPADVTEASVACDYYDSDGNLFERLIQEDTGASASLWVAKERRAYTVRGKPSAEYPNERRSSSSFLLPKGGSGVHFFYDGLNQVIRVERPDGTRLSARYLVDRLEKRDASVRDDQPGQLERYDALGRLIAVEQLDGTGNTAVTTMQLDDLGRVLSVTDASGRRLISYTYAGPGSPIYVEHADAGARKYWYDARSSLRLRTDSLGRRLVMEYDRLNRLVRVLDATTDSSSPLEVRSLLYSGGRLVEASEGPVRTKLSYDAAGRTTHCEISLDGETMTLMREYSYDGRTTAMVYPDGTRISFSYNHAGMPFSIHGIIDAVDYDEYGSPSAIRFSGNSALEYSFDAQLRRLERAKLRFGESAIRELEIKYDVNGNIGSLIDHLPDQTLARRFIYDDLHRLTRAQAFQDSFAGSVIRDDNYGYSPTGDLLHNEESIKGQMSYNDPLHTGRLTSFLPAGEETPAEVSYDEAGRITAMGDLTSLKYDIFDRLIEATTKSGSIVHFTYDHRGIRVRKQVIADGSVRQAYYLENLYERSSEGTRLNIYLGKLLVAARWLPAEGASETLCLLTDHLGSVLAACTVDGGARGQQVYTPFGHAVLPPSSHDRFIGLRVDDELGLIQFGARYYCPAIGRFITPDWYIIENSHQSFRVPQGLNAYSYSINNPLALRDASGLWFGIDDLIAAAVGFVVGFIAGVIHGAVNGYSFGDILLNGLEGGLLGAVGAWLAWNTLGAATALFGVAGGMFASGGVLGIAGGVALYAAGGLVTLGALGIFTNAVVSGAMQIYDWGSWTGWVSFLVDYSWGIVGTALGGLLHITNIGWGNYQEQLSRRQNRHVYDGGFGFGNYAFTQGNVISNLGGRHGDLLNHESLHILQSRLFGPIFQATYVAWLVVGGVLGIIIFGPIAAANGENYGDAIMDVAYRDNPWETWAYSENPDPNRGGMFYWGE